jgi:hypothetical protein
VQVHRLDVAPRQNEPGCLAILGTDGAEDIGRRRALIVRRGRAGALFGPATGDLVLLADPGLVAEPDLYIVGIDALLARDLVQARREVFF